MECQATFLLQKYCFRIKMIVLFKWIFWYIYPRTEPVSSLPNFAQLALGSGQRLQSDEVITYCHTVGIHLHQKNTQRAGGRTHRHTQVK